MMKVEFRNMDMNDELGWPAVCRSFEKWKKLKNLYFFVLKNLQYELGIANPE